MRERSLGRFLRDDDELVLRQAAAAELRWRREDPQVGHDAMGAYYSSPAQADIAVTVEDLHGHDWPC